MQACFFLFILIAFFLPTCSSQRTKPKPPQVKNGIFDLRNWDFEKDGPVDLAGEWEFYWNQLLTPSDFAQPDPPLKTGLIVQPRVWNKYRTASAELTGEGYATYRLKILLRPQGAAFAFYFDGVSAAYALYVNGKKIGSNGVVGRTHETMLPSSFPIIFELDLKNFAELEVVVHVSNFNHAKGGIRRNLKFGIQKNLQQEKQNTDYINFLILGSIFIMSLYHLTLFSIRTKDRSPLYFGLFCLCMSVRAIVAKGGYIHYIFPDIGWEPALKIEYLTFSLALPAFAMFIYSLFKTATSKTVIHLAVLVGLIFSMLVMILSSRIFSHMLPYLQIFTAACCVYSIWVSIRAVTQKLDGARIFCVGWACLATAVIVDILYWSDLISVGGFGPLGVFLFVFAQALLLSMRFSKAFVASENLSDQLKSKSLELESKNKTLLKINKLKDEFLANTSHELRTPINGIIGIAESLVDGAGGRLPETALSNLGMVITSGRRLSGLVNDILDSAKLKNSDIELHLKPVNLNSVVGLTLALSKPLLEGKAIRLDCSIADVIPAVQADENRLQQIFLNLTGNAIKFTESGEIVISAQVVQEMVEVTVADTGIGIAVEKFESIFQSFEQADASTAREYGGTGLGLSICRQLVELHGGRIWVESAPGQGSRFIFSLPVSSEQAPAEPESNSQRIALLKSSADAINAIPEASPTNGRYNILIVDDEPINLQVLSNHLLLQKYSVTRAKNGMEALEAVAAEKPDLVLLDVMMPKLSGYEVCEKLRADYPPSELPILLLTAKNQVSDLVNGFHAGANDYLSKPFSKTELLARIRSHIELSQLNLSYRRFVPHEFLQILNRNSILDVELGDNVQADISVLFSDIRSFTALSEKLSPEENFRFINGYLGRMGPAVRRHNGFIDKYIGDAIMALFPSNADDAVRAALEMLRIVPEYNRRLAEDDQGPIQIGIGIHTGPLMLGTVGEQGRLEGTVIGDTVNLAAFIESMTKRYEASLIVSEQTFQQLDQGSNYITRVIDYVKAKGKTRPIRMLEICDSDKPDTLDCKLITLDRFNEAMVFYIDGDFGEALRLFEKCLQVYPNDCAARLLWVRCRRLLASGKPEDWDGSVVLEGNVRVALG